MSVLLSSLVLLIPLVLVVSVALAPLTTSAPACTFTLARTAGSLDGASIAPGAVICLEFGDRGSLRLTNFRGTATAPITFVNSGGVVRIASSGDGVLLLNSEHVRLTGSGVESHCGAPFAESDQRCGITVTGGSGRGVSGIEGTRQIEVDHVEVNSSAEAAINLKSPTKSRSSGWVQEGIRVHHNYLHDITRGDRGGAEGLYLGMSDYANGSSHLSRDVDVYQILVARTGWEGLQVSSAAAPCKVRDNVVLDHSLANEPGQMSGITLKNGSSCNVTGNRIVGGRLHGIFDYGHGGNLIAFNRIESVSGDGIKIRTGSVVPRRVDVTDNTILGQGGQVVGVDSGALTADSVIARNGPTQGGPTWTPVPSATASAVSTSTPASSPTPSPSGTALPPTLTPTAESTPVPSATSLPSFLVSPSLQAALDAAGDPAAADEVRSVLGASGRVYVQVGDGAVVVAAPD